MTSFPSGRHVVGLRVEHRTVDWTLQSHRLFLSNFPSYRHVILVELTVYWTLQSNTFFFSHKFSIWPPRDTGGVDCALNSTKPYFSSQVFHLTATWFWWSWLYWTLQSHMFFSQVFPLTATWYWWSWLCTELYKATCFSHKFSLWPLRGTGGVDWWNRGLCTERYQASSLSSEASFDVTAACAVHNWPNTRWLVSESASKWFWFSSVDYIGDISVAVKVPLGGFCCCCCFALFCFVLLLLLFCCFLCSFYYSFINILFYCLYVT